MITTDCSFYIFEICFTYQLLCSIHSSQSLNWVIIVAQSLSCAQLFVTPWTAACQASLSFPISWSLLKCMSIESVMPSNRLILCRLLLLLPSIFPIRVFSNESEIFASGGQRIEASASASVLPMNTQGWFLLGLIGLISLMSKGLSRAFSSTTAGKHQFFGAQPSLLNGNCISAICKESLVCEGVIFNLICATGLSPIFHLVEHLLGDLEKGSG